MIGSIIGAILTWIANFLTSWLDAERAKENEYAAQSLEAQKASIVEGQKLEADIQAAGKGVIPIKTKADLLKLTSVVLMLLFLAGCYEIKVTVNQYKPVINKTPPTAEELKAMTEGPEELTPRESAIATQLARRDAEINTYNKAAISSNKKNGYPVYPVPGTTQEAIDKMPSENDGK